MKNEKFKGVRGAKIKEVREVTERERESNFKYKEPLVRCS